MRFTIPDDARRLGSYLPAFLALAGEQRWKKRVVQLGNDALRSPWTMKIVADYHWLEMELSARMVEVEHTECVRAPVSVRCLAALHFAAMIVEVHRRSSAAGRMAIEGRLRDGLKSGFPAAYLEMEVAKLLMEEGFDVGFPDLEGEAGADLSFTKGHIHGEVECKSQSADAGRKVHRPDFYRFIDEVSDATVSRALAGFRELLLVTVADRFPHENDRRRMLVDATRRAIVEPGADCDANGQFTIERRSLDELGPVRIADARELHAACRNKFGHYCHVAGPATESGACLVVARSCRGDDTSKPLLDALKKAQEQLASDRPGFIAMQFNDIEPQALILPHLRERCAIVSNYLFRSRTCEHLAATYFCAYAGLHIAEQGIGTPAFACWNPTLRFSREGLPFQRQLSDADFARALGVAPGST